MLRRFPVARAVNLLAIWLAHFCREQPDVCIDPIYTLMRRFQGSHCGLYLTALQPIILHASLRANNYVRARYMLSNHPVMEVDARVSPTVQDLTYLLLNKSDFRHSLSSITTTSSIICMLARWRRSLVTTV